MMYKVMVLLFICGFANGREITPAQTLTEKIRISYQQRQILSKLSAYFQATQAHMEDVFVDWLQESDITAQEAEALQSLIDFTGQALSMVHTYHKARAHMAAARREYIKEGGDTAGFDDYYKNTQAGIQYEEIVDELDALYYNNQELLQTIFYGPLSDLYADMNDDAYAELKNAEAGTVAVVLSSLEGALKKVRVDEN